MVLAVDPWRWQPHPEVWFLVASVIGLGLYATRVIGPKVVPPGRPITTTRQKVAFVCAVLVLWVASDWPVHDIAEENLYLVHMVQHFLFTLVMAPLFLLAVPEWLARLVLDTGGPVARVVQWLTRPIQAMVVFFAMTVVTHAPFFVNTTVRVGELHYLGHLAIVLVSLVVWMPVCGPLPERRLSLPGQMIYLFVLSILPTVPAAWLTIAEGTIYDAYDHGRQLWGMTATEDQQAAGLFMKLFGGLYLWTIITTIFFRWAGRHEEADREGRFVDEREVLTWDQVEREFGRSSPAPSEG
jgi:putative membrane protein